MDDDKPVSGDFDFRIDQRTDWRKQIQNGHELANWGDLDVEPEYSKALPRKGHPNINLVFDNIRRRRPNSVLWEFTLIDAAKADAPWAQKFARELVLSHLLYI